MDQVDLGRCTWCNADLRYAPVWGRMAHKPGCPEYDPESQRETPDVEMGMCLCGHAEGNHVLDACLTCTCLRYTPDE